ncbi:MAG: CIC family chloride channel protein [Planctomycetota bacterium]|jgi:CIC family chloride channel protein
MITRPHLTLGRMVALTLIGLMTGSIASMATIGFIEVVGYLNQLLFVDFNQRATLNAAELRWVTIGVLTIGGLVVGLLLRYGAENSNLGPTDVIQAAQLREECPSPVAGACSTLAAILSLGCGAPVGQYGPVVYLGSLVGQITNRLPLPIRDIRNIAIACGVAAAISTAFNAPIAALIFTHEVILRHYSLRMFAAVTVASASGYLIDNTVFDSPTLFLVELSTDIQAPEFLLFAIEGIACGILAVIFMRLLEFFGRTAQRLNIAAPLKPMLAGFILSLVVLQIPEVLGAGQDIFRQTFISDSFSASFLLSILVAKLIVTTLCIGFGFAGGVIFPAMLIGVLFGALFALSVPPLFLAEYSDVAVYAICAMAALMSPIIGAPMTAVLLVFELTRNYEITIAAMITIVFANFVSHHWYGRSLYDRQLLARGVDLSRGREPAYLMRHKVGEYIGQTLPVIEHSQTVDDLNELMAQSKTPCAVITDHEGIYQGQIFQHQLLEIDSNRTLTQIEILPGKSFTEETSIWQAMKVMRNYLGEAIPVIEKDSGRYLGSIPEATIIGAYLDAGDELRREEYEA